MDAYRCASPDCNFVHEALPNGSTTPTLMNIRTGVKRLRGAIGTALTWSIAWAVLGMILRVVVPPEGNAPTVRMLLWSALHWSTLGAVAGSSFAMCMAYEGLHSLSQFSMRRTAMWGVLSGVVVPLGMTLGGRLGAATSYSLSAWSQFVEFGAVGCLCAVGCLMVARNASRTSVGTLDSDDSLVLPDEQATSRLVRRDTDQEGCTIDTATVRQH